MVSRLMLNLQNPLLFEKRARHAGHSTDANIGPFMNTVPDPQYEGGVAITDPGVSAGGLTTGVSGMWTDEFTNSWWSEEEEAVARSRARGALWYDRTWVSGTASTVQGDQMSDGQVDTIGEIYRHVPVITVFLIP